MSKGVHVLHTKWVHKTERDVEGIIERLKARLVCLRKRAKIQREYLHHLCV